MEAKRAQMELIQMGGMHVRSLNLLKFSLNHPMGLPQVDDDGDEVMEIDDEAVEELYVQCGLQPASREAENSDNRRKEAVQSEVYLSGPGEASGNGCIEKQGSEVSDVSMDEGISDMDDKNEVMMRDNVPDSSRINPPDDQCVMGGKEDKITDQSDICRSGGNCLEKPCVSQIPTKQSPIKASRDGLNHPLSDLVNGEFSSALNNSSNCSQESVTPSNISIIPCDVPRVPTSNVSPRILSSSQKSLRTSSILTASQKDPVCCDLREGSHTSSSKASSEKSPSCVVTARDGFSTTEHLAATLHQGLEIIDSHQHGSPLRRSPFRFSFKAADLRQIWPVEKVDVGVQTLPQDDGTPDENAREYLCSNCKSGAPEGGLAAGNENSNLQLVPIDGSLSAEQSKKQVPKAVEKVLTGAIRREMVLEEFCAKQTSEIVQLNRLVQQYKHERECNVIIGQMREDKIIRLENLMDGMLPTEDFLEEELISLKKEHELLKEKYENHPEVLRTKIELKRAQHEQGRYQNFFDMGERDVLLEEIHDLRVQLQYYMDNSSKPVEWQRSLPQLTYSCEPSSSSSHLNTIPESSEENTEEKLEQERLHWTEVEGKWISLAEELRMELDASRSTAEKLKQEVESEKKCSEELKEALQLAMEGHARMLEQYADLEEKHMQLLARHRNIQVGIDDVKRAAARAGVRGAESKFISALAAEISALKVEREKERRHLREENKVLQTQLRDTAEAVQAAGELLVRLKEAEEAVATAQKQAVAAEEEAAKAHKQIDKLKKKHEKEISTLNQTIAEYRLSRQTSQHAYSNMAKYDVEDYYNTDDQRWKQEFEQLYDGRDADLSKFGEPSSWFSGYDRCNI
ncbi:TRAFAC class myosin-kinesin ATPase super [Ancistrocladus abbreviatus]